MMRLIDADKLKKKFVEACGAVPFVYGRNGETIYIDKFIDEQAGQKQYGEWVWTSERLPNREEYCKNDARFIDTDGNRIYEDLFDIYDQCWLDSPNNLVRAWMTLPEPPEEVGNE